MISAGEVGAVFIIADEASPVLKLLMDQMNALQGVIEKTQLALKELKFPPGLNRSIGNMDRALTAAGTSADAMAGKVASGFAKIDGSVNVTQAKIAALKAEMRTLGTGVGVGVGPRGTSGVPGSGRRPGQRTGFTSEAPAVPLPYGPSIRPSEGNGGFWAFIGGAAALDAVKHLLSSGGELETEKKLLRDKLGSRGTEADVNSAVAYATKYATDPTSGVIGESISENLKGIRDLMSVTPSLEAAEKLFPTFMRTAKSLEELTGEKADKTMPVIAKALENLGGGINPKTHELDPARMQEAANQALMTIVAGGGFIDAATLFGFAKQAGGMGRITTDMGKLFDGAITSLIDVGGQRTGTAFAALGRQFLGDKMTVQTATALEELGLLPKGSWKKGGGTGIIMNPGFSIKGVDEIKDPEKGIAEWFKDTVAPLIFAKHGGKDATTVADVMEDSYKLFGQQTGQRLALMFLQNEAQRQRDVDLKNGVNPDKVYKGIGTDDYDKNLQDVGTSLKSLEEVLGGPGISLAIDGLHLLSGALHELTKAASVSPTADKAILGGITGLGAGLVAGGISRFFGGPGLWASGQYIAGSALGSAAIPLLAFGTTIGYASQYNGTGPNDPSPSWLPAPRLPGFNNNKLFPGASDGNPINSPSLPASAPANVNANINAPLTGTATATFGPVSLMVSGAAIAAAIAGDIKGMVAGMFAGLGNTTGSSNGFDGSAHPVYPDHAAYGHGL